MDTIILPPWWGAARKKMKDNKEIKWSKVSSNYFHIFGFICIIGSILTIKPPFFVIIPVINAWFLIDKHYYTRLQYPQIIKQVLFLNSIIGFAFLIGYLLGGWLAVIIIHLLGVTYILYMRWDFIKQANKQITERLIQAKERGK